jgi:hypothetical protein
MRQIPTTNPDVQRISWTLPCAKPVLIGIRYDTSTFLFSSGVLNVGCEVFDHFGQFFRESLNLFFSFRTGIFSLSGVVPRMAIGTIGRFTIFHSHVMEFVGQAVMQSALRTRNGDNIVGS